MPKQSQAPNLSIVPTGASPAVSAEDLRDIIATMDGLSLEGFCGIEAIAQLAIKDLSRPSLWGEATDVLNALRVIVAKTSHISGLISHAAERALPAVRA
jgi:hypothetical protein